jgi:hypothetical protein
MRPHSQLGSPFFQKGARGRSRRGTSLMELVVAVGLGIAILGVGYRAYFTLTRADDYESKRHAMMLDVQNLAARIKQDVRAANLVVVFGDTLALNTSDRRINYHSLAHASGVERSTRYGRGVFRGVSAQFEGTGGGVRMRLWSELRSHRRSIRVEISTFVSPRNR